MKLTTTKKLTHIPANKLRIMSENPRNITQLDLDKLVASIKADPDFINLRPVLVVPAEEGMFNIYAGTQRYKSLVNLGQTTIPCFVAEELSEHKLRSRMLIDNSHMGEWQFDSIDMEFSGIDSTEVCVTPYESLQTDTETSKSDEEAFEYVSGKDKVAKQKVYYYELIFSNLDEYQRFQNKIDVTPTDTKIADFVIKQLQNSLSI